MAEHIAESASRADVATALALCTYDDTLTVPAGTETWTSALVVTKGIVIAGAGTAATVITCSAGEFIQYVPDATTKSEDHLFALSGFAVDGDGEDGTILLDLDNSSTTLAVRVKIGGNVFRNHGVNSSGTGVIGTTGQIRGVIYDNVFDRCNVILKWMGLDELTDWANFDHSDSVFGSADNLYFEDNTIQFSSGSTKSDPGWIEVGQGMRWVIRYNVWDMAGSPDNAEYWDIHGFQNWPGGQTGAMNVEMYGNILINGNGPYRWINHRAFKCFIFNNRATGTGGYAVEINQYEGSYEDTGRDDSEIEGAYFWNNWGKGALENVEVGLDQIGTIDENVRFWNYKAGFDGSVGIGIGADVPEMNCTTGVGYWRTAYSPGTTPPTTMDDMKTYCQAGDFYKATGTNTWEKVYEPYTYPHPLRGEEAPPTTFRVFYDANGAGSGSVPTDATDYAESASVTVLGNTGALSRGLFWDLICWNTQADGEGDDYLPGSTLTMPESNVTLYAKWRLKCLLAGA